MIRVTRGDEPRGLKGARARRLRSAIAAHNAHGPGSKELSETLVEYGTLATKKKLFVAQHKKCAWCERRRDLSSSPVEHYRPKDGAWRHLPGQPPIVDRGCYWWLTWTWANLLFSCDRCNDQGHKANYFPLLPRTAPLPGPPRPAPSPLPNGLFDVTVESPLLLDPANPLLDPLDHITWEPVDRLQERDRWTWSPRGRTPEGKATITILKLHELADEVGDHLRCVVLRGIEEIEDLVAHRRDSDARSRWDRLLSDALAPKSQMSAAAWCAIEAWMPAVKRVQHGFADPPRPGR